MFSFKNDYSEGAHPRILQALIATNEIQTEGYGNDVYSQEAATLLKKCIERPQADVHLLSGGTQTNLTALSAFLRPHEAAIAADSGHILVHETGAIEATGHKVISVPAVQGKLTAAAVESVVQAHSDEHMVKPKLAYISQSTEIGTIYSKHELSELSAVCRKHGLLLYLDGARLGSALCATGNDLALPDIAALVDAFYIGGTKNGALLGEALVICNEALQPEFRFHLKQKGALLAKGKVLGIQFCELFRDGLYFELAAYANARAAALRDGIQAAGYRFLTDSPTNQIFPILPNPVIERLQQSYDFYSWEAVDATHSAVRLVTSWATPQQAVQDFIADMNAAARK